MLFRSQVKRQATNKPAAPGSAGKPRAVVDHAAANPKREIFKVLARIGAALASPVRLELLEVLGQAERSVEQLARLTGASMANTSQHLQKLKHAGLIVARKEGLFVRHRVAGPEVTALFVALAKAGEFHLADVERLVRLYFTAKDELEPVGAAELLERSRAGLVTVLDVRPAEEYAAGHVPGAVNIPLSQLAKRLGELPSRKDIVAYCRGPYCLLSFDAVALLRARGRNAHRLIDGLPEWRLGGWPVEVLVEDARTSG